jgi:hypothetical protein
MQHLTLIHEETASPRGRVCSRFKYLILATDLVEKLCKSVGVKQVKQGGFLCFGGRTVIDEMEYEQGSEYLRHNSLWRAYYDIVEDTGQIAKGHVHNLRPSHCIGNVGRNNKDTVVRSA